MPGQPSTAKKGVRGPQKPTKTPVADETARPNTAPRTVRPRQLHVNDKIRVVVGIDDPEVAKLDGGALLEWLQKQDEEAEQGSSTMASFQPKVAVIGHNFKPIPANLEAPELSSLAKPLATARQEAVSAIATPSYINVQSTSVQEGAAAGKSAYIRYVVPTPDDEEATVEYDLDEEDEEWLQKHNHKAKQKVSEDEMEQLMDALEKMHHAELQKHPERWANLIGSPMPAKDAKGKSKASVDQGLHLPDVDTVLPLQTALQGLASQHPAAVKAVYLHWCQKRQFSERPLLQRLWYEPPWHRLTVAGSKGKAKTDGESEDDVPFMVQEERRPLNRVRKTMQLQDVDSRLRDMRDDLEQVRILADQCRRREKLRKRGLATWQQDMQGLLLQAITLDQQLLGTSETSSPAKAAHAGKLTAAQGSKKQPGSKGSHSKAAQSKQLLQLVAEIADATENAQAKFEHDMALSLQLTNGVADEAAKLHRVKIVRAESSHSDADADDSELPSEAAQEAAQEPATSPRQPSSSTSAAGMSPSPLGSPLNPSSQLEVSPRRLTRSMLAQASPTSSAAAEANDLASASQRTDAERRPEVMGSPARSTRSGQTFGGVAARPTLLESVAQTGHVDNAAMLQASPSRSTRSQQGQGSPVNASTPQPGQDRSVKASLPASPQVPDGSHPLIAYSLSSRRAQTVVNGQSIADSSAQEAALEAAAHAGCSAQQMTRSMQAQASASNGSSAISPSVAGQAQRQPGQPRSPDSQTHRQTRSTHVSDTLPDSQTSSSHAQSSEEEGEGHYRQGDKPPPPAGPSEGASPVLTLSPSSSSLERRGKSARTPAQHSVASAARHSPHSGVSNAAVRAEQQGQVQLSPRQTRSQRAQAPHGLSSQGSAQQPQGSSLQSLPSPQSHDTPAEQIASYAAVPLSSATVSHQVHTRHSSRVKGKKSVRFSLAGQGQDATAAPDHEAEMAAIESSLPDGKLGARTTRSGKVVGAEAAVEADCSPSEDLGSAQAALSQHAAEAAVGVRTTRSGRSFNACPDQSSEAEASSLCSDKDAGKLSALDAADKAEGPASSSPALNPDSSQAAAAAASGDSSLRHPWEQSLLGIGLALSRSEDDRLSDRGRPPTTDHPCHKRKSASMTRRTLSPPLTSPRLHPPQQEPPSTHDASQHAPEPSQLPHLHGQLPSSQPHSVKTTVDRGCDPIVFLDESEPDKEEEPCHKHSKAVRPSAVNKGKKRVLSESAAEQEQRVTRQSGNPAGHSHSHAEEEQDFTQRPVTRASAHADAQKRAPAMHTPTDRPSSSEADNTSPAARPVTRTLKSAGMSHPGVNKALGRFGATPAGKPPLPPTASKAVSAYQSAQKQKQAPVPSKAASLQARASSPGLPPDPSSTSSPGSSLAAAPTSHQKLARPVTRRSKHQQQQQLPDAVTDAEWTTAAAESGTVVVASPPTTRSRHRNPAASPILGAAGSMTHLPGSSSQSDAAGTRGVPASEAGKLPGASKKRRAEVSLCLLASEEAASRRSQATAGKAAVLKTAQQSSSKRAADRLAKTSNTTARSAARQGSSGKAPATSTALTTAAAASSAPTATAAAEALKQAAASGKLGCPKCRGAAFGCKKCRAAYVKSTGIAIPIDRSLHADIFSTVQQAAGFNRAAVESSRHTPGTSQKPSDAQAATAASTQAHAEGSKLAGKPQPSGKTRQGQQPVAAWQRPLSGGQMRSDSGQKRPASGLPPSADGQSRSAERPRSAKRTAPVSIAQEPACKKQKGATGSGAAGTASTSATATTSIKRVQAASSPVPGSDCPGPVAAAAKRRRLSQTPTATAAEPRVIEKPSAAACTSGRKSGNRDNAAAPSNRPSSSAKNAIALAVVRDGSASKKPSPKGPSPAPPKQATAKTPAAPASKQIQAAKPKSGPAKSATAPKVTSSAKSKHTPSKLAAAPAQSKPKSVASPKAMSAARIKRSPSARAAAAVGSALVQGIESKLGCSKCRFVSSGCKRCRAKQAGQLSLGTQMEQADASCRTVG